ncbi:hypothetical protein AAMO2058_001264300 [Amorphochlora amoebiformis]
MQESEKNAEKLLANNSGPLGDAAVRVAPTGENKVALGMGRSRRERGKLGRVIMKYSYQPTSLDFMQKTSSDTKEVLKGSMTYNKNLLSTTLGSSDINNTRIRVWPGRPSKSLNRAGTKVVQQSRVRVIDYLGKSRDCSRQPSRHQSSRIQRRSSSFAKKGLQRTASHGLGRASEGRGVGSPSIGRTASHGLGRTTNRAVDRAGSQGIERGTKDAPV